MTRNTHSLAAALATALLLAACGGSDDDASGDNPPPPGSVLEAAQQQAAEASAAAALPQPDANKPLSEYPELDSGNQIMFLYVAAAGLPPDYAKLAESYSRDYRTTSDTFRKNDLLEALRPQLDQRIAEAGANPYGWMQIDDADLGAYDFERKGFPVNEFSDGSYRYFSDNSSYRIGWSNNSQAAFAPVVDEQVARQIESMRNDYRNRPQLKIFFFAQSADLNSQRVSGHITRVQITDRSGRVLTEYGPGADAGLAAAGGAR